MLRTRTAHIRQPVPVVPKRLAVLYKTLAREVYNLAKALGDEPATVRARVRAVVRREFGGDLQNGHYDLIIAELFKLAGT
jgi:hypothetical protein